MIIKNPTVIMWPLERSTWSRQVHKLHLHILFFIIICWYPPTTYNHIGNLHSLILQQNRFLFCLILSYEHRMVFILTRSFISIEYSSIGENSWNDLALGICITPSNLSLKITLVLSTSALEINLKIIFWIFSLQNWDISLGDII